MSFFLEANDKELAENFYSLQTSHDVARLLEISYDNLRYYLYTLPHEKQYTVTQIPR